MTKEELEKEAEEKYCEVDREFIACQDEGEVFNIGYVLGAEPREKHIAELERNVAYYAERAKHAELAGRDYVLKYKDLGKRCLQLQKDKGNLTDRVRDLEEKLVNADYQLEGRDLEIKELKAQIEKMKCCGNCAKRGHICVAEEMQGKLCGKNKDKWELRR